MNTEVLLEKIKLRQLIVGAITYSLGFITPFIPMAVTYLAQPAAEPIIDCKASITITMPQNKAVVKNNEIDVVGVVEPKGSCQYVFLIVENLSGHKYCLITDAITVNPDGSWEAIAKLPHIPMGGRARIQARLCGASHVYPPEGCLEKGPVRGVASNSIIVRKRE